MNNKQKSKLLLTIIAFLSLFFSIKNVYAECTYQEQANLNNIATKVKTNYEIIENVIEEPGFNPDTGEEMIFDYIKYSFKISIYNLTDELYVTQKNSVTNETKTILFSDAVDTIYTYETDDIENIVTYTYNIYSNLDNCKGNILKTYTFKKPKQNPLAQYQICANNEDIPFCRMFITENYDISSGGLDKAIAAYQNKKEIPPEKKEETSKFMEFLKNNYLYVIGGVIIVGGGAGTAIYFMRKRSAL